MALPWQADFNACAAQPIDDRFVWWWPAQRPEFVYFLESQLQQQLQNKKAPDEKIAKKQVPWVGTGYDQNAPDYVMFSDDLEMVKKWHQLGFVFDVSPLNEYRQSLEKIGWEGTYFAEVERTLEEKRTLPNE